MANPERSSSKTALIIVLSLLGLGCLGTGVVLFVFVKAVDSIGGSDEWTEDSVPERELPTIFECRLPKKPLVYRSRQFGFQDAFFEVLVELPSGSAEDFLKLNHLSRGTKRATDAETMDLVHGFKASAPMLDATEVELPADLVLPDGGTWQLHRSVELLEGGGEVWVHFTAFES